MSCFIPFIRLLDSIYSIFFIQEIETEANNQPPIHGWNANIYSGNDEEDVNFGSVNTWIGATTYNIIA